MVSKQISCIYRSILYVSGRIICPVVSCHVQYASTVGLPLRIPLSLPHYLFYFMIYRLFIQRSHVRQSNCIEYDNRMKTLRVLTQKRLIKSPLPSLVGPKGEFSNKKKAIVRYAFGGIIKNNSLMSHRTPAFPSVGQCTNARKHT